MKFLIFGTQVKVSFLFVSIITFMIFIDKSGFIVPMTIAVLMHEMAHLLCMRILGCQPKEILLIPGGIQIIRSFCTKRKLEIIISLSGPFINLFLFLIFLNINSEFSLINLCIGCFNLLPISSLDGGEILEMILSAKIGEERAKNFLGFLNFLLGAAGIILGIFLIINGSPNISLIIFSLYLILSILIKF